ncbi:MAG: DUF434 domain-containing protein [Deltaproteobacteria bacterium]|nr:DUF434 domain-containing protein [Deltaproteobacteria bacterium]
MTRATPLPHQAILKQAAADFRYLLDRGYPRAASLTLVGNRYNLSRTARQMLHRGVFAAVAARARQAKLQHLEEISGLALAVDGHNVLITLESALRGRPLVLADDGFVRDVAELSRAFRASRDTELALELLAAYLQRHQPGPVTVLYDAPMSKSGELARHTREVFAATGLAVEARAVPVPEQELLGFPGAVATSDTHLIDARDRLVDLAGEIIRQETGRGRQFHLVVLKDT